MAGFLCMNCFNVNKFERGVIRVVEVKEERDVIVTINNQGEELDEETIDSEVSDSDIIEEEARVGLECCSCSSNEVVYIGQGVDSEEFIREKYGEEKLKEYKEAVDNRLNGGA